MSVDEELAGLVPTKGMVLTVGVFDGVHLGHKRLLSELTRQAKNYDLISGVVTFRRHPQRLFHPESSPPLLTSLTQKIRLFKDEGVEVVIPLSFTLELAQTGARQFIGLLQKYLKMRRLVLGPDSTLGRNQEGNVAVLRQMSQSMNFELTIVPQVKIDGEVVSSTAIRRALAEGNIEKANRMLGRYFNIEGYIVTGAGRGTELGFPTANLEMEPERALPSDGIYASWAYIGDRRYQSVTNIGIRPTFGDGDRTVEIHIIDFEGDLYRQRVKIDIIHRLRDEKRFSTADALQEQMKKDIKRAVSILKSVDK
jgi:riboflavin kinase/FMN adenylyltransferase